MTRLYLTSLILCMLCFNVNADNLPPGITNRLSIAGYDLDQNGVIDTFESLNVKTLSWYGNDGDINKYLKYFRNLDSLNLINDFVVVDVDLSLNENLKYISYNISNIEKIQFSTPNIIEKIIPNANFFSIPSIRQFVHAQINETASLEYKDVEIDPSINPLANYTFTQLDSIKTGEVKHLYHLEALISSAPNLVYLHMGKINDEGDMHFNCPELRYLRMHGYDAINPTFDLPKIEILIIPGNGINNDILDLSSTDNLKYLDCSLAKYEEIIFGDLENLEYLDCSRNRLSSLILENTPNLKSLFCNNNNNLLKTLELHNAPVLETLHCYTNKISALDVSNLNNLKVLFAGENKIENLNVSNLIKLERLECNDNLIQNLDLSNSTKLYNFECQNNLIESLNLNNLDSLINLTCSNNNLTSLALSNQHYLQKLECYDNSISELNVEDAFSLRELRCSNNNLTELNVNNNLYLDYLDCSNNQLETLTILNITSHNIVLDENPELSMICCDNHEVVEIQSLVDGLGYTCEVNSDCSSEVILNYVYIPFDGVRNSLLLENNLDINKDNRLSFDEVEDITHLEISRIGRSSNDNAFPLDGLEAFQNLQSLHINENFTELNAKPLRINDFLELEELIFLGEIDHPTIIENLPKLLPPL